MGWQSPGGLSVAGEGDAMRNLPQPREGSTPSGRYCPVGTAAPRGGRQLPDVRRLRQGGRRQIEIAAPTGGGRLQRRVITSREGWSPTRWGAPRWGAPTGVSRQRGWPLAEGGGGWQGGATPAGNCRRHEGDGHRQEGRAPHGRTPLAGGGHRREAGALVGGGAARRGRAHSHPRTRQKKVVARAN